MPVLKFSIQSYDDCQNDSYSYSILCGCVLYVKDAGEISFLHELWYWEKIEWHIRRI